MKYYKIINNSEFVGVGTDSDMRKYQLKHHILLVCAAEQAQYIQNNEILYHAQWMVPESTDGLSTVSATVTEITEEEYNMLYSAIESGAEIPADNDDGSMTQNNIEDTPIDSDTEVTIEFVKEKKISEMSTACQNTITNGFDVVLSDDETHHFSLTTQDQLNLITLITLVASGKTSIPYHADGELCKFYSAEDITLISTEATNYKTYHVSYFNSLKAYIESLDDMDKIAGVTYGVEIPEEFMSDVMKALVSQ